MDALKRLDTVLTVFLQTESSDLKTELLVVCQEISKSIENGITEFPYVLYETLESSVISDALKQDTNAFAEFICTNILDSPKLLSIEPLADKIFSFRFEYMKRIYKITFDESVDTQFHIQIDRG
jgi:hypothetical protein